MTEAVFEQIKHAIVQLKAIEQIPAKSRLPIHETEFLQHLNLIRANQLEFFTQITKDRFFQCRCAFLFNDGVVSIDCDDSDIDSRLRKVGNPTISSKDLTDDEINELIVELDNAQATVYGGLYELTPIKQMYQSTYKWAESVYKSLCLAEHEWEGESTFAMLVPREFMVSRLYLDRLAAEYEVRLASLQSTYEKLSRLVTLRMSEPGTIQRGQKDFKSTDFSKKR